MKFTCLTLFTLFLTLPCTAQVKPENMTTITDSAYQAIYNEYKALHIKLLKSETHKKSEALCDSFYRKIHADKNIKFDMSNYTYLDYIKANLANTDFKSYDEAEKEWKAYMESITLDMAANKDVYDYEMKLMLGNPENVEIITQVNVDVFYEMREKETTE